MRRPFEAPAPNAVGAICVWHRAPSIARRGPESPCLLVVVERVDAEGGSSSILTEGTRRRAGFVQLRKELDTNTPIRIDFERRLRESGPQHPSVSCLGADELSILIDEKANRRRVLRGDRAGPAVDDEPFDSSELEDRYTDLRFSPYGAAFLTDAIIVQRYIEVDSRLERVMAVVKVRASVHSNELRLYRIADDGIHLGEMLSDQEGLLGGRPTRKQAAGQSPAKSGSPAG